MVKELDAMDIRAMISIWPFVQSGGAQGLLKHKHTGAAFEYRWTVWGSRTWGTQTQKQKSHSKTPGMRTHS